MSARREPSPAALAGPRFLRWLQGIDPSIIILLIGIALRIEIAARFNVNAGYDAPGHIDYVRLIQKGLLPRVGDPGVGGILIQHCAQHPPLYYFIGALVTAFGTGMQGLKFVSVASGAIRLILMDRLMCGPLGLSKRTRAFSNMVHAFMPFGIRMDVFASNESLAATLSIAAVYLALYRKEILSGLALGGALLTKATAVAAIPPVAFLLFFPDLVRLPLVDRLRTKQTAIAMVVALALLLGWAWPNLVRWKTPYPSGYVTEIAQNKALYETPLLSRHRAEFYYPRISWVEVKWPYWNTKLPPSAPNTFYIDAWGDYYNFLGRAKAGTKTPMEANQHPIDLPFHRTHLALVYIGLPFALLLAFGVLGAVRRVLAGSTCPAEIGLTILAAGYLGVTVWYGIWVVFEFHGAVKAAYALGALPILAIWTGRALDRTSRVRGLFWPVVALSLAPLTVEIVQRIVW